MKRIVIHQPNLFPRLKVLQKIASADIWVIFDDVQYMKREWQNRTRLRYLKQPSQEFWLTVPVYCPSSHGTLIKDIFLIQPNQFYEYLQKTTQFVYGKSNYWNWIESYLHACIAKQPIRLRELCVETVLVCFQKLDINMETIYSSSLNIEGKSTRRLASICSALNADLYVSGSGSRTYMDLDIMNSANVKVAWQDWQEPFINKEEDIDLKWRNFSFIDFLARFGPIATKAHITSLLSSQ